MMATRTERVDVDSLIPYCQKMEDARWAVRQIVPITPGGGKYPVSFIVVFERETP